MKAAASELLREGAELLRAAGVEDARRDARVLLAHAAGVSMTDLIAEPGRLVDPAPVRAAFARRAAREPAAFITGVQEFWSLPFLVSPATLVPRADSETVVEAALRLWVPDRAAPRRVLDLGTGTGCLLLAVLSERPEAWGVGVDRAADAAALARRNAGALGLDGRAAFVCGDWAEALEGGFDLVVSNPPYISRGDVPGLMPEVSRWEPAGALDGGLDGLDAYRTIVAALPRLLVPGGQAVLEVGQGQAGAMLALAVGAGLDVAGVECDLGGTERACVVRRG